VSVPAGDHLDDSAPHPHGHWTGGNVIFASSTDELEMVEACPELAERLARIRSVTDEAQHQLAARLDEAYAVQAPVIGGVVVLLAHVELCVPGRAACRIPDGRLISRRPVIEGTRESSSVGPPIP